jgi:hypothetical protein
MKAVFVGVARFELATSWSQTRRDDRTTLHPEVSLFYYAERAGFEPAVQNNPYGSLANYWF